MYKGEGREGAGAAGDYHDYNGGYLPELVQDYTTLEFQEELQPKPVVVFSQATDTAQPSPTTRSNQ